MRKPKEIKTYEEAKERALRLLEFRAHSQKELKDKLKMNSVSDEIIDEVLSFCQSYGFVNDAEYAKRKAMDLYKLKKYGRHRIEQELKMRGISSDLIYGAVCEIDFDENDLMELVKKKLGGNFERKNIDKCIRYFLYRGYEFSQIKECISTLSTEEEYDI